MRLNSEVGQNDMANPFETMPSRVDGEPALIALLSMKGGSGAAGCDGNILGILHRKAQGACLGVVYGEDSRCDVLQIDSKSPYIPRKDASSDRMRIEEQGYGFVYAQLSAGGLDALAALFSSHHEAGIKLSEIAQVVFDNEITFARLGWPELPSPEFQCFPRR